VTTWLTGFDDTAPQRHLDDDTTFDELFATAELDPTASEITGSVCGVASRTSRIR